MGTLAFVLSLFGTVCICIPSLLKGKNMSLILLFVFSANVLVATSYLLTGAFNGAASCFVGATQTIINYFFDRKNKPLPIWLISIYALAFIVSNLFVFERFTDILALVASLTFVMCIGQKNGAKYRFWTIVNSILWCIYVLLSKSYGAFVSHIILLAFTIVGMIIHDRKKNNEESVSVNNK